MAEQNEYLEIDIEGLAVRVKQPTNGQVESMVRIASSLRNVPDDAVGDAWIKQISRLGTLLDSLIHEDDQDDVDTLFLTGKVSSATLLSAVLEASKKTTAPKNGPVKAVKRARRN